jgi:phosphoenolpyruvate-protein kinase (PTS system EI component)
MRSGAPGEADDPAEAVRAAASAAAEVLASLDDEILSARAADVRDVGARICRVLRGEVLVLPAVPSIAVCDDLPPSVTAEIPPGFLLGIALAGGSRTAHAVILARSLGIPAIVGIDGLIAAVDGRSAPSAQPVTIAMDGERGEVVVDPGAHGDRGVPRARSGSHPPARPMPPGCATGRRRPRTASASSSSRTSGRRTMRRGPWRRGPRAWASSAQSSCS